MYTVTYIGMDRNGYEEEYCFLHEAKSAATFIEEHGGHTISIYDPNGEEV